tara:strand:- start:636 stop:818 length:183 start_codon:yes stop_codon:yes gene_type:complete
MNNEQIKEIKNLVEEKQADLQGWKFLRRIPWIRAELRRPPDEHDYELLLQKLARILHRER